jgi:hypothetical protein
MHWEGQETVRRAHAVLHKGHLCSQQSAAPRVSRIAERLRRESLYTIDELRAELLRHVLGGRLAIQYRHGRLTSQNYLILGAKGAIPQR